MSDRLFWYNLEAALIVIAIAEIVKTLVASMYEEWPSQVATMGNILTRAKNTVYPTSHGIDCILASSAQWHGSGYKSLLRLSPWTTNRRWCIYPRGSNAEDHMSFGPLLRYMPAWNTPTRRGACMLTTPCFCSRTPGSSQGQACLMAGTLIQPRRAEESPPSGWHALTAPCTRFSPAMIGQ